MVLTEVGHIALAEAMFDEEYFLAWGTVPVEQDWGNTPVVEELLDTTLIQEVGRIKALAKQYVVIDNDGVIEVDGVKWSVSATPTKYVYLKFSFDQTMNSADSIYQLGLFVGTVAIIGKEAELYLQPSDIQETGKMLLLENQPVLYRNTATKETYEYVITY